MNSHSPDITCSQKINSFKYRFQIAKAIVKRAVSIIFRIFGKKVFTNQNSCGIISSAFKHMLMGACSSAGRAFGSHPRGREFESLQVHQKKRSRKIFGQKTKRFQGFRGPWITKIQGPQNLDFSPLPIHSGRTQTCGQKNEKRR